MANANFVPWLGNAATSGQQTLYNSLTSGFQAGGFVKAEDFNAALRMTTLMCAGIADVWGFNDISVDSSEEAIATALKNPAFDTLKVNAISPVGSSISFGTSTFIGHVNFNDYTTFKEIAQFEYGIVSAYIDCSNGDMASSFKNLNSTAIHTEFLDVEDTLAAEKANIKNLYGEDELDGPIFPQGIQLQGESKISGTMDLQHLPFVASTTSSSVQITETGLYLVLAGYSETPSGSSTAYNYQTTTLINVPDLFAGSTYCSSKFAWKFFQKDPVDYWVSADRSGSNTFLRILYRSSAGTSIVLQNGKIAAYRIGPALTSLS